MSNLFCKYISSGGPTFWSIGATLHFSSKIKFGNHLYAFKTPNHSRLNKLFFQYDAERNTEGDPGPHQPHGVTSLGHRDLGGGALCKNEEHGEGV